MNKVKNIHELSELSEERLLEILGNAGNAKKLWEFFHDNHKLEANKRWHKFHVLGDLSNVVWKYWGREFWADIGGESKFRWVPRYTQYGNWRRRRITAMMINFQVTDILKWMMRYNCSVRFGKVFKVYLVVVVYR